MPWGFYGLLVSVQLFHRNINFLLHKLEMS